MRRVMLMALALLTMAATGLRAQDQTEGAEDNSFIINLLEDRLSTDTRRIRLSGVEGVLARRATVDRITISDPEGVWLQIDDALIDWNRSALLRGRVEVNTISAERITFSRTPIAEEGALPDPGARSFQVPELPVSVRLDTLDIREIILGEPVLGREARLSAEGSISIADGSVEARLQMQRLDGAGGEFALSASFANETEELNLDLHVAEPQGGVFATLLGLEGAPPLETSITAQGRLDDLRAEIDFVADGEDLIDGVVLVDRIEGLLGFEADFEGRLRPMLPPQFHGFFAETSTISAAGRQRPDGGFVVDRFGIDSGGLELSGALATTPEGFPVRLELSGDLAASTEDPLVLPVGGPVTTVTGGELRLNYGDGDRWDGYLMLSDLQRGGITIGRAVLSMQGDALNLTDATARRLTADLDATLAEMTARDPGLNELLEGEVALALQADWQAGAPVTVERLSLSGAGSSVQVQGQVDSDGFRGAGEVEIAELGVFAPLTGRDLGGAMDIVTEGRVNPLTGAFDIVIDGRSTDLKLDIAALDRVLQGETVLSGGLARDVEGLRAEDLRLVNDRVQLTADGRYSPDATQLSAEAAIADLANLTPQAEGAAQLSFEAEGDAEELNIELELSLPEGRLADRPVQDATVTLDAARDAGGVLRGQLDGGARIAGADAALSAFIDISPQVQRVGDLTLTVGPSRIEGTVKRDADGLFAGTIDIDSPDITDLAALALTEGSGAADLTVALSPEAGTQRAEVSGSVRDLAIAGNLVGRAELDLAVSDLFGVPLADGQVTAERLRIGPVEMQRLELSAETIDGAMALEASAELENGTRARLRGGLETGDATARVRVEELVVEAAESRLELYSPTVLELRGGQVSLTPTTLRIGEGLITARARVAEDLDVDIRLDGVPLDIANAFVPEQEVGGVIDGAISVSGSPAEPVVQFDVAASDVTAQVLRDYGLPAASLSLTGETREGMLDMSGEMTAGDVLEAQVQGTVPFDTSRPALNVRLQLRNLDMAVVERFAPDQGIDGSAAGSVIVTGSLDDPAVEVSLNLGLQSRMMNELGLRGSNVNLEAGYRDGVVTLQSVRGDAGGELSFEASGTIPLSGPGLNVAVAGQTPLVPVNVLLARSQSRIEGFARADISITGRLDAPRFGGRVDVTNARFASQRLNIELQDLNTSVLLEGTTARITEARARLMRGGEVALQGTLALRPDLGLPADLSLRLRDARYTDGNIVRTRGDADVRLTGPILRRPTLSGEIRLDETEISVPRSFGIDRGLLLDVRHRNPPRDVSMTLGRAALTSEGERVEPRFDMNLDVLISSPRQLFIRGRGLDVEMGGEIRLRGSLSDLEPVGQIELIRGRLGILGERIDFDEGAITLTGSLDPRIRLVAETTSADGTIIIVTVAGSASDPEITFSSIPELPQDEVLAQLIFDRPLSELSPFQIAQLAAAAATLAGSGGGLTDDLRASTGLANLDLTTGEDGEFGVRAGAYLGDNIYLDVETQSDGDSRAAINLDITRNLRGRVSVDSEGESKIGIFYERDY